MSGLWQRLPPGGRQMLRAVAGIVPPPWRQRPDYRHWRRFLDGAQRWAPEQIEAWQVERLREIVRWAIANTDGYRELYAQAGIQADDLRSTRDVRHLPFTTKELFRDNLKAFTHRSMAGRYVTTGGSTGIPFGFYEAPETGRLENAFMQTGWSWTGWRLGRPSAVLRGAFVGTEQDFQQFDPYHRELFLSSYFLTAKNVGAYLEAIRARGIRVLQAYPSSLNLLCDLIRDGGLDGRLELDVIFLGSENVYPWQLEKAEKIFPRARLFAWYGHCEKAVLAPWCEKSRRFHVWPYYGLGEVVRPDGAACDEGDEGEIIGTSFHQRITPFIRYRTLDRAVRGPAGCPDCGRAFLTLTQIAGRAHEVIVTRGGRYISMTAINMHDDIFDPVRQFQFLQEQPGQVIFQFVPKDGRLSEAAAARIRQGLEAKLGPDVELGLRAVESIPRTRTGKFRFLDQRLPIQYGDRS